MGEWTNIKRVTVEYYLGLNYSAVVEKSIFFVGNTVMEIARIFV